MNTAAPTVSHAPPRVENCGDSTWGIDAPQQVKALAGVKSKCYFDALLYAHE
jgi:hypothetical protein